MSSTHSEPKTSGGRRRGPLISALFLVALFLGFEGIVAMERVPGLRRDELDPISKGLAEARIGAHPYLAYAVRPDLRIDPTEDSYFQLSHNSLGFRGPETTWEKPEGVWRIVCLGGSSTYGFGPTTDATNWPVRLEARLNARGLPPKVEVINLAAQGYSTFESLIQLALRGVDLKPDLVLVYHTINDMRSALYPGVNRDNTHWRAVWPLDRPSVSESLLEKSGTYRTWRRYATDWVKERGDFGRHVIVDYGRWWPNDFGQPTDMNLGFLNFERNLKTIVATARAHGSEVLLVTQAVRLTDFDNADSAQLQRDGFERATQILRQVAEREGAHFYDARPPIESEADRRRAADGHDGLFTETVHLTDIGCDLLAAILSRHIVESQILPIPAAAR